MPNDQIDQIHEAVHACLVKAWGIPDNGGFYLITERPQSRMRINRTMWGIDRSAHPPILLQITSSPRSLEMKTNFYKLMAAEFVRLGFRSEDLFISITPSNQRIGRLEMALLSYSKASKPIQSCLKSSAGPPGRRAIRPWRQRPCIALQQHPPKTAQEVGIHQAQQLLAAAESISQGQWPRL